jgi:hypothetical protein
MSIAWDGPERRKPLSRFEKVWHFSKHPLIVWTVAAILGWLVIRTKVYIVDPAIVARVPTEAKNALIDAHLAASEKIQDDLTTVKLEVTTLKVKMTTVEDNVRWLRDDAERQRRRER